MLFWKGCCCVVFCQPTPVNTELVKHCRQFILDTSSDSVLPCSLFFTGFHLSNWAGLCLMPTNKYFKKLDLTDLIQKLNLIYGISSLGSNLWLWRRAEILLSSFCISTHISSTTVALVIKEPWGKEEKRHIMQYNATAVKKYMCFYPLPCIV